MNALREAKIAAGDPSVRELTKRVCAARRRRTGSGAEEVAPSTVWYCFDPERRRLNYDLVFDLLRAMSVPDEEFTWWRQVWRQSNTRHSLR